MHRKQLRLIVALAFTITTLTVAAPASAHGTDSSVIEWNGHASNALMNPATAAIPGAGQGPTVAVLHLAMVQSAVYDAVSSIDRGHEPYINGLPRAVRWASKSAALATAAPHVLVGPPYPDHPSGYNCLSASMMYTARNVFDGRRVTFTVVQTTAVGAPSRTYNRFTDVVKDTIDARLFLGIHVRTPDEQGAIMGRQVAHWLDRHYFERKH